MRFFALRWRKLPPIDMVGCMKFLLTNDDGIDAPGLALLAEVAAQFGEVLVVAPVEELSGCSHQVTAHKPFRLHERGENRFAVEGTPADCVRVGLKHLAADVDVVLSGVNDGGNLGVDVYMSGTVAAVREATLLGVAGIALSRFRRTREPHQWDLLRRPVAKVLPDLLAKSSKGQFWNVNFPDASDVANLSPVECPVDTNSLTVEYRTDDAGRLVYSGDYQQRPHERGTDVDVCFSGGIAISRMVV
jgi:5'-nucleotidase